MGYEKLSKQALKCMYTVAAVWNLIAFAIIGAINWLWLIPSDITIGKIISVILMIVLLINLIFGPYFRYNRYRYSINEECIDISEGYLFVERTIVPIERLHKLQTQKGPIARAFHVEDVVVTTAGGDVKINCLDEEKAETIAENLRKRINEIVKEQREADGK